MAYKEAFNFQDVELEGNPDHFWNLTESVGWGCQNYYDDVMLVQFFLNTVNNAKLVPDGLFGNKTYTALKNFQRKMKREGPGVCYVDGQVDRIDGTRAVSTKSKTIYTIISLNAAYYWSYQHFYDDIRKDRNLPPELCHLLTLAI